MLACGATYMSCSKPMLIHQPFSGQTAATGEYSTYTHGLHRFCRESIANPGRLACMANLAALQKLHIVKAAFLTSTAHGNLSSRPSWIEASQQSLQIQPSRCDAIPTVED